MLFAVIVSLSVASILCCRFISESRKVLAVALICFVFIINNIIQFQWEIYEVATFFQKIVIVLLFTVFLLTATLCCRGIATLLKYQMAFAACMLIFCTLSICVWERILNISSDMLSICMFAFMSPLYPLRHVLPVTISSTEIPPFIILVPLAWLIGAVLLWRRASSVPEDTL